MEAPLRAVVETMVDGVILIDATGSIVTVNPACERMFGYSRNELLGKNVDRLMPSPLRDEGDTHLRSHQDTGKRKILGTTKEVLGSRKDGSTFPMELSVGEAVRDRERFYVGIARDISDRKHAEANREKLIEQLTVSNEELGYFAYVASHDLNQSLRMISAFCGLVSAQYHDRLDERGREYLALAVGASERMRDLLDDILEYGRLGVEGERGVLFDSNVRLDEALGNLREAIEASHAIVTRDALPSLYANPIRFTRLMQNLIGNAIKYVAPGTTPQIHIAVRDEENAWRFEVRDNGIGIDDQYHAKIFNPFQRLHTTSEYPGTGMGLAICDKIVRGFGGELGVRSTPGQGSTFVFSVPKKQEEAQHASATAEFSKPARRAAARRR